MEYKNGITAVLYVADTNNYVVRIANLTDGSVGTLVEVPMIFSNVGELQADLVIYYCEAEAESLCLLEQVHLLLPFSVADGGESVAEMAYAVPLLPVVGQ